MAVRGWAVALLCAPAKSLKARPQKLDVFEGYPKPYTLNRKP